MPVPDAAIAAGMAIDDALALQQAQLQFANRRAANCAAYYDRIAAELGAGK